MCVPLAVAAAAAAAAGSLVQGYSALTQGNYESGVNKQNAALERESAQASIKAGETERRDYWRKIGSVKGQNAAAMAANGIDLGFGTAERIEGDTQSLANEDAQNLYENIHQRTRGHIINAFNYKNEAKAAKARGRAAMVGSVFSAAGSMMGGFQQQKMLKAKLG